MPQEPSPIPAMLERIKAFYAAYAPVALDAYHLLTPAADEDIARFEAQLGAPLAEDLRVFWQSNDVRHSFSGNFDCLDLEGAAHNWQRMTRLLREGVFDDGRVERHEADGFGNWDGEILARCWWHPLWVPFAEDSCGNLKCIDGAPGKNGRLYQVIQMEIQDGQGPFASESISLAHYLEKHLEYLQKGQFTIEEWGIEVDEYASPRPLPE